MGHHLDDATFEEMYSLGVPVALLARRFGMSVSQCYSRADHKNASRPSAGQVRAVARELRNARIKANIAITPSRSMFVWPGDFASAAQ